MTALWDLPDDIVSVIITHLDYASFVRFLSTCKTAQRMISTPEFKRLRAKAALYGQLNFNCARPLSDEEIEGIISEQEQIDSEVYLHFKLLVDRKTPDFHLYMIVKNRLKALNVLKAIFEKPKTLTEYAYSKWIITTLYMLEVPAEYHVTASKLLKLRPEKYKYVYMLHRRLMWRTQTAEQKFFDLSLKDLRSECLAPTAKETVHLTATRVFDEISDLMKGWNQTDSKCIAFCALSQLQLGEMDITTEIKTKGYTFCLRTDYGCYFIDEHGRLAWIDESIISWDSQEMTDMVLVSLHQCEDLSNVHLFDHGSVCASSDFTPRMANAYRHGDMQEFLNLDTHADSGPNELKFTNLTESDPERTTSLNGLRLGQFVEYEIPERRSIGIVLQLNKYSARIIQAENGAIHSLAYNYLVIVNSGELCNFHGLTVPKCTTNIVHILGEYFTSYSQEWGLFI